MKELDIILPCYNEEDSLPLYFNEIDKIKCKRNDFNFNFILVDDGSTDSTFDCMKKLLNDRNDITIAKESRNFGQNGALTAGLKISKGDYIIIMDVDLQDPVSAINDVLDAFNSGYDIVDPHRSSRKEDSFFKRKTASMFYTLINKLDKKKVIPSNVNLFRGLSRRAVDLINSLPESDRYYCGIIPIVGLKTKTIEFKRENRKAGKSKYNVSKLFDQAFNMISTTTSKPLYTPIKVGTIGSILSLLLFVSTLVIFILNLYGIAIINNSYKHVVLNLVLMLISFISLIGFIVIFFIGILGIYQHNILINTRNRPNVIIDKIYVKENNQIKEIDYKGDRL